ncbi:MAG: hypothetical protein MJB12_18730 [Firmicutes bacterium]|nr:hypothetical protein [Bacillota bacterium]
MKQLLFGLGVTKNRIIVIGDVRDGNTSNKDWNKDILKELRSSMKQYGLNDFIYVADSAAVTKEMLQGIAGEGEDETGIEALENITVILIYDSESKQWYRKCNIDRHSLKLLELAGLNETVYTKKPKHMHNNKGRGLFICNGKQYHIINHEVLSILGFELNDDIDLTWQHQ